MICVSIVEPNVAQCIEKTACADMAEIRIDLSKFSETDVQTVFSQAKTPTIATCRPEIVSDTTRVQLLKTAIIHGAAYVDIEIESSQEIKQEIVDCAKHHHCKVIISYHNYNNTPSNKELQNNINQCFAEGAHIAKLATTATSLSDSARILALYAQYKNHNIVALAMGEKGAITRVANIFLGSPFTFAAFDSNSATAPGQLTVEECKKLTSLITERYV
ncbi:MAG: type I 3-dehydroquinate dehydratase [Bacteroidales bacterium]|jgi:3-dehydroquinate dehydratase type I|nr:type I 3-dehydroquinate dehydratase [Bacteroidales bacterium]